MKKLLKAIRQKVVNKLESLVFGTKSLEREVTLRDEDLVLQIEHDLYVTRRGHFYRVKPSFEGTYSQNPTVCLKYMGETRIFALRKFQTYGALRESH